MRHVFGILASLAMMAVLACGLGGGQGPVSTAAGSGGGAAATPGSDEPASGGDTGGATSGEDTRSGGGVIVSGAGTGDSGGSGGSGGGGTNNSDTGGSGTSATDADSGSGASAGSSGPSSASAPSESSSPVPTAEASSDTIPEQTERLQIVNKCSYTIWIQQQNMPSGTPSVVKLKAGESAQYVIPEAGLAATRLWPKKGCDADGHNCLMGQSSPPCPTNGCPPPVDSKFEATWGCVVSDRNACAINPSAPSEKLSGDTYWNASAVDGYTFPFTASVTGNTLPASICSPVDCGALKMDQCPTSENLSVGVGGAVSTAYSSVDLNLKNNAGELMGCYAPCTKMTYPTYGGLWLSNSGTAAAMYCCPTPPVSPSECSAGPVEDTLFVSRVRSMCGNTVYTYAYDDGDGLRQCSGATKVRLIIGPNCP